jgi:hypothetical protein
MSSNYSRYAGRTKEQFIKDIKEAHKKERDIAERISIWYKTNHNKDLHIEDNGVDNTGEYLEVEDVTTDADFVINGDLTEIKYHIKDLPFFRMKYRKLISYIKQKAYIILVNGYNTPSPRFCIITPKKMYRLIKKRRKEGNIYRFKLWEWKMVVAVWESDFKWYSLPDNDNTNTQINR